MVYPVAQASLLPLWSTMEKTELTGFTCCQIMTNVILCVIFRVFPNLLSSLLTLPSQPNFLSYFDIWVFLAFSLPKDYHWNLIRSEKGKKNLEGAEAIVSRVYPWQLYNTQRSDLWARNQKWSPEHYQVWAPNKILKMGQGLRIGYQVKQAPPITWGQGSPITTQSTTKLEYWASGPAVQSAPPSSVAQDPQPHSHPNLEITECCWNYLPLMLGA